MFDTKFRRNYQRTQAMNEARAIYGSPSLQYQSSLVTPGAASIYGAGGTINPPQMAYYPSSPYPNSLYRNGYGSNYYPTSPRLALGAPYPQSPYVYPLQQPQAIAPMSPYGTPVMHSAGSSPVATSFQPYNAQPTMTNWNTWWPWGWGRPRIPQGYRRRDLFRRDRKRSSRYYDDDYDGCCGGGCCRGTFL